MTIRAKFASTAIALAVATPALAQEANEPALSLAAELMADTVSVVSGGVDRKARYLQNLDLVADVDLDRAVGLSGTKLHLNLVHSAGTFPNDAVGALQCIDNIEVWDPKLRVFEAWVEKDLGKGASLRAGIADLNGEFYTNPAASLLVAPPFAIGSELAATGVMGPSIFPVTGLGARLQKQFGKTGYIRAAVYNARPGLHGGGPGSSLKFDEGVISIAQAGVGEAQNISVGVWSYSKKQENWWAVFTGATPVKRRSHGAYVMVEQPLLRDGDRRLTAFVRSGISDGETSIFKGSWQAGVLASGVFKSRPDSQASFGVAQGAIGAGFRGALSAMGARPAKAESMIEATYSDKIAPFLSVQPDILYVIHPGGDALAKDALVLNLRFTFRYQHAR